MTGIVEWTHDVQCAAEGHLPLPPGPPRWADDYLHGVLFKTDKEYDFFAAVAGVRRRFGRPSLIPARGVPPHVSGPARNYFDAYGDCIAGWLHLSDVAECVSHIADGPFHTGFELGVAMAVMRSLVVRLTDPHVRLVFNTEDCGLTGATNMGRRIGCRPSGSPPGGERRCC